MYLHFGLSVILPGVSSLATAQNTKSPQLRIDELNRRLEVLGERQKAESKSLTDELAQLKTQKSISDLAPSESFMGLGAAASKFTFQETHFPLAVMERLFTSILEVESLIPPTAIGSFRT